MSKNVNYWRNSYHQNARLFPNSKNSFRILIKFKFHVKKSKDKFIGVEKISKNINRILWSSFRIKKETIKILYKLLKKRISFWGQKSKKLPKMSKIIVVVKVKLRNGNKNCSKLAGNLLKPRFNLEGPV